MSIWKRLFGKRSQGDMTPPPNQPATKSPASSAAKRDSQSATKDRVVRVFISSTFRDMVEDRNELMSHVWPALRRSTNDAVIISGATRAKLILIENTNPIKGLNL